MTGAREFEKARLLQFKDWHGWVALYDYLHGWDRTELIESIFCLLDFYPDGVNDD